MDKRDVVMESLREGVEASKRNERDCEVPVSNDP